MLLPQKKCLLNLTGAFLLLFVLFSVSVQAQKKKTVIKPAGKQTPAASKTTADKENKNNSGKNKDTKSTAENKKIPAPKSKGKAAKSEVQLQKEAEIKRFAKIEEAKKRAEQEARQRAALEEKRRRDEAIRQAQARKLAFERGLRTETIENITHDNIEGEDLIVRLAAVNALGNRAGTVVVLEPRTGKVLTIVNQDWAIRKSFKPCSTIKLVTAIAGVNENLIDNDGNISTRRFPMNLDDALAHSNNIYFQKVGAGLGSEKMILYARMLGLGQPTGINSGGESSGKLPFGNNNARIYSHGDDFEVTPLQLAVLVSAISNGGKLIVPKIPRSKIEQANFRGQMRGRVNLPPEKIKEVIPGMVGATTYGTARRAIDSSMDVAGKTGSCISDNSWVGLFASVAPIENPQYTVIVITRGEGERGKYAAAVAGKVYAALRERVETNKTPESLAIIPSKSKPRQKIDAKVSAQIDSDEGEDSEENDPTPAKGKKGGAEKSILPVVNAKKEESVENLFPTVIVKVKKTDDGLSRPRIVSNH